MKCYTVMAVSTLLYEMGREGKLFIHHRFQNCSGVHPRNGHPGIKRPDRIADHSTPCSAEKVKNA